MKNFKYFIFFSVVLLSGCLNNHSVKFTDKYQPEPNVLSNKQQITDPFVRVLGLAGIRIKDDYLQQEPNWPKAKLTLSSRRLEEINQAIQGKKDPNVSWLINGERWQTNGISYLNSTPIQSKAILDLILNDLQFGKAMFPKQNRYTGILFLGSSLTNVRERLKFLNLCLDKYNLIFGKVYILTGIRPLEPTIGETKESLLDPKNTIPVRQDWKPLDQLPTDEGPMIEWVFNQSRSKKIKKEQIETIYAGIGKGRQRATTRTTVEQWLKTNPKNGLYLIVSSQPFNLYQKLVVQNTLLANNRPDIKVEVIGDAFAEKSYGLKFSKDNPNGINKYAAIALDNIARTCYELVALNQLSEKQ